MGASFEFLTTQNNFSSNACSTGPRGEGGGERGGGSAATKGEVTGGDGFGGRRGPRDGTRQH